MKVKDSYEGFLEAADCSRMMFGNEVKDSDFFPIGFMCPGCNKPIYFKENINSDWDSCPFCGCKFKGE